MDSVKNLQTKEGRVAAIETIEKSLLKSLRINLIEISDDAVCSIDRGKATIGIKPVGEYKKKGFKMAFASEIDIFAINDKYCFGKSANEINFGSSGSFSPEIRECYWRTIHAASFLKNWKVVCDIVNEHCKMYSDLEKEIIKVIILLFKKSVGNNLINKMDKKEKMEVALPKPTIEEQESLGLIKKPKPSRIKKNHKLKIFYMIGDANGKTSEEAVISINNPFLKPLTEALDKLGEIEGHWGSMLDEKHYDGNKKIGNINDFEYELLSLVTGYSYIEENANDFFKKYGYDESEQNHDYLQEFEGLLISDTEYSFLVYVGYKLK